jgi:hypothetical protein
VLTYWSTSVSSSDFAFIFSKSACMYFIRARSTGLFKQARLLSTLWFSVSYRFNIGLYSFAGQGDLMLCFSCYPFPSKFLRFLQFRHHRISFSLHYVPFNIFQTVDYHLLYVFFRFCHAFRQVVSSKEISSATYK